jgi:hypothetical protein
MCSGTGGKEEGYEKEKMSKSEREMMRERERIVKD